MEEYDTEEYDTEEYDMKFGKSNKNAKKAMKLMWQKGITLKKAWKIVKAGKKKGKKSKKRKSSFGVPEGFTPFDPPCKPDAMGRPYIRNYRSRRCMLIGGPTHRKFIEDNDYPPLTDTEYYRGTFSYTDAMPSQRGGYSAGPSGSGPSGSGPSGSGPSSDWPPSAGPSDFYQQTSARKAKARMDGTYVYSPFNPPCKPDAMGRPYIRNPITRACMRLGGPTHIQLILEGRMRPLTDTEYYGGDFSYTDSMPSQRGGYSSGPSGSGPSSDWPPSAGPSDFYQQTSARKARASAAKARMDGTYVYSPFNPPCKPDAMGRPYIRNPITRACMRLGGPTHIQLILEGRMRPLTDTEYYGGDFSYTDSMPQQPRGYSAGPSSSSSRPSPTRVPSPVGGYSSPRTSPIGPSRASSSTRTSPIGPSRAPSPPLGPPGFPNRQLPPWLSDVIRRKLEIENEDEDWLFGKNKKSRSSCFGSCNSCRIK